MKPNEPLFFITLDKGDTSREKEADKFAKDFGIALVRGCFAQADKNKKVLIRSESGSPEDDLWKINVLFDPVQYKIDLETIVAMKSKFIEEIYSESQLLIKLEKPSHLRELITLRNTSDYDSIFPNWLKQAYLG